MKRGGACQIIGAGDKSPWLSADANQPIPEGTGWLAGLAGLGEGVGG